MTVSTTHAENKIPLPFEDMFLVLPLLPALRKDLAWMSVDDVWWLLP